MQITKWWKGSIVSALIWSIVTSIGPLAGSAMAATYIVNGNITDGALVTAEDDCKKIEPVDAGFNRYTDYANGYSILYPSAMVVDVSLSAVRTLFGDDKTSIEVYHDNFTGTITSPEEYILYSNKYVTATADHNIQADRWFAVNGFRAHLLAWTRRPLARVPGDKNNYVCAEIIKNTSEVYTIFIKSRQAIDNPLAIISSLLFVDRQGVPHNARKQSPAATMMNAETKAFYDKYFAADSPLRWGV